MISDMPYKISYLYMLYKIYYLYKISCIIYQIPYILCEISDNIYKISVLCKIDILYIILDI